MIYPIIPFVNLGCAIRQLRLRLKLVKTHKGKTQKKFASQQEGTSTFVPLHYNKYSFHQAQVRSQQNSIHIKACIYIYIYIFFFYLKTKHIYLEYLFYLVIIIIYYLFLLKHVFVSSIFFISPPSHFLLHNITSYP